LVDPGYIDRYDHVRNLLMEPRGGWRWLPKPGAYEVAANLLAPAVRFRAQDCFDAPPQTITRRKALLSDEQNRHLKRLRDEALTLLQGAGGDVARVSAANAGVLRSKSLQIFSGAVYDDAGVSHKLSCADRLNVLDEVAKETNDKIIVLEYFTPVLRMIYEHLSPAGAVFVDGSVPLKDRSDAFERFKTDPNIRFLVAQPEILKFGLDLSAASVIIWYGPVDKTETWIQANQRICGPNQKKPTVVICVYAHKLEEQVYDRLGTNEEMQSVFLALVEDRHARAKEK